MRRTNRFAARPAALAIAFAVVVGWTACGGNDPGGGIDAATADAAPPPPDAFAFPDAPPPVPCGPDLQDGDPCAHQYELCVIPGGCCACGGIVGFCANIWVCSTPAANDATCPPAIPGDLSECTVAGDTTCEYCNGDIPVLSGCSPSMGDLPCAMTGFDRCWRTYPQGASCD